MAPIFQHGKHWFLFSHIFPRGSDKAPTVEIMGDIFRLDIGITITKWYLKLGLGFITIEIWR